MKKSIYKIYNELPLFLNSKIGAPATQTQWFCRGEEEQRNAQSLPFSAG